MPLGFHDEQNFPQFTSLRDNWTKIRDETDELDLPLTPIHRVGKTHKEVFKEIGDYVQGGGEYGWLKGWGLNGINEDWIQLVLVAESNPIRFLNGKMAYTLSLLNRIPGVKVAALVRLKSNTFLPTHCHKELAAKGILQLHLTLDAASEHNYAYLNVEGEFRQHVPGQTLIFDGSLAHFAINASQKDRTILYVEFQRDKGESGVNVEIGKP
ncbi:aspartyl/asparaginyl beta-hydroxylase domain-containing protein [Lentilitoribacter sp. EG35]|uniref:aspartyl/asparaginyl beta-hydroxylase domain-containing protein n=1 Tax=Lentilitoribacter sp. EG35 TaxID=3234192 RepID=UPI00345F1AF8